MKEYSGGASMGTNIRMWCACARGGRRKGMCESVTASKEKKTQKSVNNAVLAKLNIDTCVYTLLLHVLPLSIFALWSKLGKGSTVMRESVERRRTGDLINFAVENSAPIFCA